MLVPRALAACTAGFLIVGALFGAIRIERLECESQVDPAGLDRPDPSFGWILKAGRRGARQSAYQVLVSTSLELLSPGKADMWDSGQVASPATYGVRYKGRPLESSRIYYWTARVWDEHGQASDWAPPGRFITGLLDASEWNQVTPIGDFRSPLRSGPLVALRREFRVSKPVQQAILHVAGLGFHHVRLNGERVGDRLFSPGWTNYRASVLYETFDVTNLIRQGENALAVILGNGFYNVTGGRYTKFKASFGSPRLLLKLVIRYRDGVVEQIHSDRSWRLGAAPILFSCIYGGEDYDARAETSGWDQPGFNDQDWRPADVVDAHSAAIRAQQSPPIRVMQTFNVQQITEPRPGVFVYDLGQNFSGRPRIVVSGPRGATVRLIPGEVLDEGGLVSQRDSGGPFWFRYTLKGEGREEWAPEFTYYGFRWVQVEGAVPEGRPSDGKPVMHSLVGEFTHASVQRAGQFETSDELLNRIHRLVDAAVRSNLQSVLTDCPHREKLGWLEVTHLMGPSLLYNYDLRTFLRKIVQDMAEAQQPSGFVPNIAPEYTVFRGAFRDSPEWGSAYVLVPWLAYLWYDDREILAEHFEGMERYVRYLASRATGHIVSYGLGDWFDVGPQRPGPSQLTSMGVTATAIYYQDIQVLQRVAGILGYRDKARQYEQLAREVRRSFHQRFWNPAGRFYDRGSQAANAMALVTGLAEPELVPVVLEKIVADVQARGNHTSAGDVGHRYVLRALAEHGRSDLVYAMATNPTPPSYAYQLSVGATTLTESWDASRYSRNHCMLGHIEEWFYAFLAGIRPASEGPGFQRIVIDPQPVPGIQWVRASYESVRGTIRSSWKFDGDHFLLDVEIPVGSTADVYVPASSPGEVSESARPLPQAADISSYRQVGDRLVVTVPAGRYTFRCSTQRTRR